MRSLIRTAILALLVAAPAFAQHAKPTREQVVKLLDLMNSRENIRSALDQQSTIIKEGVRKGFLSKQPKASEATLQKLDALFDGAMAELTVDELFDASVPVYQNNLTIAEVQAMTDFYNTPTGQQILKKMPKIIAESMQAGGAVAEAKMAKIMQRMDQQIQELINTAAADGTTDEKK
jgi:uncharacterized protein